MKRTAMPRRLSPLQPGVPLRRSRLKPVSAKRATRARLFAAVKVRAFARDGGCCVYCGQALPIGRWHPHHRLFTGQGGTDDLWNVLPLHSDCHRAIHCDLPRVDAEALGLIVPSHADPALIPVSYFDGTSRLLTERNAA